MEVARVDEVVAIAIGAPDVEGQFGSETKGGDLGDEEFDRLDFFDLLEVNYLMVEVG
jgi:hypothetical protein